MEHEARKVLFVCTRNSARSQLAAALWRQVSEIPSASAGTHPADRIARGAIEAARRHGLDLEDRPPRRLDQPMLNPGLVVTVCDNAHEELAGRGDVHWSVPDPLRLNTDEAFEEAFVDLASRITGFAPRVLAA
jgi:protein-tyrosine-phosphatase